MTPAALELIARAALAFRRAGAQTRLYPGANPAAHEVTQPALEALTNLLRERPSFVITYDDRNIAFDGEVILRYDLQPAIHDLAVWMRDGELGAIGFAHGVQERELTELLNALAVPVGEGAPLCDRIRRLALTHIRALPRVALLRGVQEDGDAAPPPETATPQRASHEKSLSGALSVSDFIILDPTGWADLARRTHTAPVEVRRKLMVNMARWLRERPDEARGREVDAFLCERIAREEDTYALQEAVAGAESRLSDLLFRSDLDGVSSLLRAVKQRLEREQAPEIRHLLAALQGQVGESDELRELLERAMHEKSDLNTTRDLVAALGDSTLLSLIISLKTAKTMEARGQYVSMLRAFGSVAVPALITELRAPNPWYVHRNLLQVLAEVGTSDALGAIYEKQQHDDARVRVEAVTAAARIAKCEAEPYLLLAMGDSHPDVRARAASYAGVCGDTRLLSAVTRLLATRFLRRAQPVSVQVAACQALGQMSGDGACRLLVDVARPRLLPFGRKRVAVRVAAVAALGSHLPSSEAGKALQRAQRDGTPEVRQAAQRALVQHVTPQSEG